MDRHPKQLSIPDAAKKDVRAIELLRVWVAGGQQHVAMATNVWDDPALWGMMLVDLAKHIADAYSIIGGRAAADALERIKEGFDAEWSSPTDTPSGGIRDD